MQSSDIPYKFAEVWAAGAGGTFITDPIPQTASGAVASQHLGFPPQTALPEEAGGTPPNIADFNGIGFYATAWLRWQQAGAPIPWDSTFSAAVGGYPKGCVVGSATTPGRTWTSTAENNTTNPDTGGAGWVQFPVHGQVSYQASGLISFTVPALVTAILVRVSGAGGGAVGSGGASGAGGGYVEGWIDVTPGAVLTGTVGAGGAGSVTIGLATNGGTTSFQGLAATGGTAGNSGPGSGGVGSGGTRNLSGGPGTDLDTVTPNATGGGCPGGGQGGTINNAAVSLGPTAPGGGGGCNQNIGLGQNGANGEICLTW